MPKPEYVPSPEKVAFFKENGFVTLDDVIGAEELARYIAITRDLLSGAIDTKDKRGDLGGHTDRVDAAVENTVVVVICISRAYKESANCRMEANYALQREVKMVPCMMEEGYRPDGWLGMILGTKLWYGFYGAAASDPVVFGGKVEELCRELGERGRGGDDVAAEEVERPRPA